MIEQNESNGLIAAFNEKGESISPLLPETVKNFLIDIDGTICDDIPNEERRSLASVQEVFLVEVPGIVNERDGLMAVPDDPYAPIGDWPEAETVHVTINKEDE